MHFEHFNLARPPFAGLPSPAALFLGPGHREALAALEWGLGEPSGFTLLTGEVGTGKTTLIAALRAGRAAGMPIIRLWNPHLSFNEMLRESLGQLAIEPDDLSRFGLLGRLLSAARRERLVMIFDEAQQLDDAVLEDLRLLSNAQSDKGPALQIILVGQPELLTRLASHPMRQLNQRIGARAVLRTLDGREVFDYLDCRIRAAGGSVERVFMPAALRVLARHAHGIPRRINLLCDNAMLLASLDGSARVAPRHLQEAVREYDHLAHQASAWHAWGSGWGLARIGAAAGLMAMLSMALPQVLHSPASLHAAPEPSHPSPAPAADAAHRVAASDPMAPRSARPLPMRAPGAADAAVLSAFAAQPTASRGDLGELVRQADLATASGSASRSTARGAGAHQAQVIVRAGESLSAIATRHLGSIRYLKRLEAANPQITDPNRIYAGQTIRLGGK